MDPQFWLAGAGLIVTIFLAAGGVIWKISENKIAILDRLQKNKEELDDDLNAIRISAYQEYKTLREEIQAIKELARKEFGETIQAVREKIVQVELWTRDQLQETRHAMWGRLDMQRMEALEKIEDLEARLRQLEMFTAREMGRREAQSG